MAFASLSTQEAMAVCANLPPRLLLRRVISTPADRAVLAKGKASLFAQAGFLLAPLAMYLVHLAGRGWGLILLAAAATVCGFATWGYWRVASDPTHVFHLEEWIDFPQRTWHLRTTYADGSMAVVAKKKSLDALMLLCTASFSVDGWDTNIGLCEKAEFAPDHQDCRRHLMFRSRPDMCRLPTRVPPPLPVPGAYRAGSTAALSIKVRSARADRTSVVLACPERRAKSGRCPRACLFSRC